METLVVVAQQRNQCFRSKPYGQARIGSLPSRNFRAINCRTFQSGTGILPTPGKSCAAPVSKRAFTSSPQTPSSSPNHNANYKTQAKTNAKSSPIPIDVKACHKGRALSENLPFESPSYKELWAGPTYSNSPPPSSLPIPKFSIRPKRTVSLDLVRSGPEVEMRPVARSAPPSPTRDHAHPTRDIFQSADSATKTLCRILNLNIEDE